MTEVWTLQQVADHFGVSLKTARNLVYENAIRKGYPAELVKKIPRPGQGTRTDLQR